MFRKDEHAGALTRGGRARCFGRVFCCTLILVVLILVGIVAAFFCAWPAACAALVRRLTRSCAFHRTVWVKPPDVGFEGIEGPESGSEVTVASDGFDLNVRLKVRLASRFPQARRRPDSTCHPHRSTSSTPTVRPRSRRLHSTEPH